MPYIPLSREEFQETLKNVKINLSAKKTIPDVNSSSLSNLYNVFTSLENTAIDEISYKSFRSSIEKYFPKNISSYLLTNTTKRRFRDFENIFTSNIPEKNKNQKIENFKNKLDGYVKRIQGAPTAEEYSLISLFKFVNLIVKQKDVLTPPFTISSFFNNPVQKSDIEMLNTIITLYVLRLYPQIENSFNQDVEEAKKALKDNGTHSEIVKNDFKKYIKKPSNLEFLNLLEIVSQNNPMALSILKEDDDRDNSQRGLLFVKNISEFLIDDYAIHNEAISQDYIKNFNASLYESARKEAPECTLFIPDRTKSLRSEQQNMEKEYKAFLKSLTPSNPSMGISSSDVKEQFNVEKIDNDFTGSTIVLTDVNDSIYFEGSTEEEKNLINLRKEKEHRKAKLYKIQNFLRDNPFISEELYFQIYIELLEEFQKTTYPECYEERLNPQDANSLTYNEAIEKALKNYWNKVSSESFSTLASPDEMEDLTTIIEQLKLRNDDKFQNAMLDVIIPKILSSSLLQPHISSNEKDALPNLDISWEKTKDSKKPNGFCAKYYKVSLPVGPKGKKIDIELQALTKMRYDDSKGGNSDHNKQKGKRPSIEELKMFFELSNPNENPEHLDTYLETLDSYVFNTIEGLKSKSELSKAEQLALQRVEHARNSIKMRESFPRNGENKNKTDIPLKTVLIHFAEYWSPKMRVTSSAHQLFERGAKVTANNLIETFSDVLRKQNDLTCLSQILIDKLSEYVQNTNLSQTYTEKDIRNFVRKNSSDDGR